MNLYLVSIADVETYSPVILGSDSERPFEDDCQEAVPVAARKVMEKGKGIDPKDLQEAMIEWLCAVKGYRRCRSLGDFHIPASHANVDTWMREEWKELLGADLVQQAAAQYDAYWEKRL